jgi:hypothetical protein
VGIIIYDQAVQVWQPTSQMSEISAILSQYNATADAPGCVGDALAALRQAGRSTDEAVRVLLVAGPLSRQGLCAAPVIQSVYAPLDSIIVADAPDDEYLDLAERSAGTTRRANLLTIEARLNEVKTLWSNPVYALRGTLPNAIEERGQVTLTLSQGDTLTRPVTLVALAAPEETSAAGPVIQRIPTATPAPTVPGAAAPPATIAPVTSVAVNAAPGVVEATTAPPDAPVTSAAPRPTSAPVAVLPPNGNDPPDTAPTTAPETLPEAAPVPAASSEPPADESEADQTLMLALIGGAAVLMIGFVLLLMRGGRPAKTVVPAVAYAAKADQPDPTIIEPFESFDFYGRGGAPPDEARSSDDELLITQILSDDEFQHMQQASSGAVIGWLRLDRTPPQDFEVREQGVTIGRKASCAIVIADDPVLSGEHARLKPRTDGTVWLEVLSRTNPVVVNRVVIHQGQSRQLRPQDVIQLSPQTRLVFIQRRGASEHPDSLDDEVTRL